MNFNSEQELYEYIGEFLIQQGKQSYDINHNSCMYRGPNNTKCAVGCVIPDKFYLSGMELMSLFDIMNYKLPPYIIEYEYFLVSMQEFHDNSKNWNENGLIIEKLIKFGKENNLDTSKFEILLE
jgi:hypothetical protein